MIPEDLFRGLEPPALPGSLRGRVLTLAREATPSPAPTLVDALWVNRRWRAAWTVLVLALVVGHASLSFEARLIRSPAAVAPAAPVMDLGLVDGSLPPTLARRLQNASPRPRRLRLID
ncbi:MAG TPA: hypothetical protein VI669_07270, partial [Vicinamibacteria bacterium]